MGIVLKLSLAKGTSPKRGIDHFWSVIQAHELAGETFTRGDILRMSNARRRDVDDFFGRLEKAGLVEKVGERGPRPEAVYRATVRQTATPRVRRDGTVIESAGKQKCMWNAMRSGAHRQGFTAQDIALWGSTDETAISLASAQAYIKALSKAGYLIPLVKGKPGAPGIWRLAPDMNTGPLPPMILRTKVVFDQNRHELVGPVETEEVSS
ncbi:hypothetical protein H2509_13375 [Stappia sp. F7233]|uniref:Uncharacterized protein n=1 Tax=Stappia albiluteola TaxID=2758565 RepID=A0A839AD83_9HYPH|nr:hypothetical protein [Stappia albiluteola]MBA5777443.1 hypothetical protein [Stappia albiluteola]MBA5777481.1 hypothetical protein [Stappia albiluteola]MBA5778108.1 hypothetical protein [Stappia albiluteola]MBA5778115.1 hypothetical protein [Stappia albiluteola]